MDNTVDGIVDEITETYDDAVADLTLTDAIDVAEQLISALKSRLQGLQSDRGDFR